MIITSSHVIYGADKQPVKFPVGGLARHKFNGKTIEELRLGGYDWYLYVIPIGYDPAINRLDGVVVLNSPTCTEGTVSLTAEELQGVADDLINTARFAFLSERAVIVAGIKVTTAAGNTFDGCEVSRGRMGDAVTGLDDVQTIRWVLADGSNKLVTRAELKEALYLVGRAEEAVWIEPT